MSIIMEESKVPENFYTNIHNDLRQCLYLISFIISKKHIYQFVSRESLIFRVERTVLHVRLKRTISDSKGNIIIGISENGKKQKRIECDTYQDVVDVVQKLLTDS